MDENRELLMLLPLAREGEPQSREAILVLLRARARRYAGYLLGPHPGGGLDASDVAQDALIRVLKHFDPGAFPDVPHVLAWLNEVVRSVVADLRRHNAAQKRDARRDVAGGDLFPGLASDTTDVPDKVVGGEERAEEARRLAAALQRLPENQRLVFRLRVIERLPFEEVAAQVGVSKDNARVLLYRATKSLQKLFGEQT